MASLVLPRPLVLELLHLAQTASTEGVQGLIVRPAVGELALRPLARYAPWPQSLRDCVDRDEALFACYRSCHSITDESPPQDRSILWHDAMPLLLTVSLGIKGVLQLRAWHSVGRQFVALPVTISDDPRGA